MRYLYDSDIVVMFVSFLILVVLNLMYIPKSKGFSYVKLSLVNLIYASVCSMSLNYYLLPDLQSVNINLVYMVQNSLQISLLTELLLFLLYVFELIDYKKKIGIVGIISTYLVFVVLHLTSVFTHLGFYIESGVAYNNGFSGLNAVTYISAILTLVVVVLRRNRLFISRIYFAFGFIFLSCISLALASWYFNCATFNTLMYLVPILVIVFLFHSNSYNTRFGALDREALRTHISDLCKKKKEFYFVYIKIEGFSTIESLSSTAEDFKTFVKTTHYTDYLFRYNDDTFVMIYSSDEYFDSFEEKFSKLHHKYNLGHKVVIVKANKHCSSLKSFIQVINYIKSRNSANISFVEEEDLEKYGKYAYIKSELLDIANKFDPDDERVLVFCQPILDLEKQVFTTAESLMRLKLEGIETPNNIVFPDMFIPIAEQEGLIHSLTLIMLNKVCRYIQENQEIERISVNFSMVELVKPDFYDDVCAIINLYDFRKEKLGFEITESIDAEDFESVKKVLKKFRDLGIKIYLDDFGTGYSNLEHIIKLPIDIIKFDRSLVISSGENARSKFMVNNLANMFSQLNYMLCYEGIEKETDQSRCSNMRAKYLQGYRYSRPVPIADLSKFINQSYDSIKLHND